MECPNRDLNPGLHNSYLWTYDLYVPVQNAFDAGKSITRVGERGLGPGNQDCFGPCEMASSRQASAIWGRKQSRFPGPTPCPSKGFACMCIVQGRINQRSIGSFMYMSSQWWLTLSGYKVVP
jgi:hypothetical protein